MRARVAVHAAVAFAVTFHLWGDPAHRVLGRAEGEFRDHLWVSWLVQHRIGAGASPLFFPEAGFPDGIPLYPLDPLNQAVLALLTPLLGLFPAYALLAFALLLLAGHGAARLADAAGASVAGGTLAGALFQVGPPILGVFADTQTEGMGTGWALWAVALLAAPGPWPARRALGLGLTSAAAVLSAPYQAHALTLVGVPLLVYRLWNGMPARALALAGLVALPAAALAGVGLLTTESHSSGQITSRARGGDWPPRTALRSPVVPPQIEQVADTPRNIHAWPRESRFLPPSTGPRREVGWAAPVLVGTLLLAARSRWLALGAVMYASLALGSARDWNTGPPSEWIPLPFDLWYRYFPGGHFAWKPHQYAVAAWAFACAAIGAGRWPGLALLPFLELQFRGATPLPLPVMEVKPLPIHLALRDADPGGVIEFPCRARGRLGPETLPFDSLLHQIVHEHPIGETFGRGQNPAWRSAVDSLASSLRWPGPDGPPVAQALSHARDRGFRHLVVFESALTERERGILGAALVPVLGVPTTVEGVGWYRMGE